MIGNDRGILVLLEATNAACFGYDIPLDESPSINAYSILRAGE
jgi:hypothetical protein